MKKILGAGLIFLLILFSFNTLAIGLDEVHLPLDEILPGNIVEDIVGDHDGQVNDSVTGGVLIQGRVTNACLNYPCAGATVSINIPSCQLITTTDSAGHYSFMSTECYPTSPLCTELLLCGVTLIQFRAKP